MSAKDTLRFMLYYLAIAIPIGVLGGKYLIKIKRSNEDKANRITFICLTAPFLIPVLIGVFLFIPYGIIYLLGHIISDRQLEKLILGLMIVGGSISIYLGIKAYIAIYRSYFRSQIN